ncbi:MAG: ATP-binding cassette domain-containing protein [Prevotellaceae bacterium]|jgi:ABC-type lipoprotein export system ATPase subunit|nr:ATP-binding cassette domain-containing protein [Prevotellaceae bacterium]
MDTIQVNHVVPYFISDTGKPVSEIWHKEVRFSRNKLYLISASSGAGKSSLLSYIFGERTDYSGDFLYDDVNGNAMKITEWTQLRTFVISCVFQGLRLFPELTALENVSIKNHLTGHKTEEEIKQMFVEAGLEDKVNDKVARLSFGQQQRIAVIRALCQPFDFLLMDEPFSHLDDDNVAVMSKMVASELKSKNAGLILCSLGPEYPFAYDVKLKL